MNKVDQIPSIKRLISPSIRVSHIELTGKWTIAKVVTNFDAKLTITIIWQLHHTALQKNLRKNVHKPYRVLKTPQSLAAVLGVFLYLRSLNRQRIR